MHFAYKSCISFSKLAFHLQIVHFRLQTCVSITKVAFRFTNATFRITIKQVETIHSVKGCSYSAVLLVSSPNASGKTGYWENWINDKLETTRMAYVASTRPKHLLCWALPKLTDEQRT